jgi:hypothetical protein
MTPRRFRRCLLLLADGATPDGLARLLADGALPNLARLFPSEEHRRQAVTVFPSTTGPAHLPYLTGCFPGTCDVPGIRWFDPVAYERSPLSLDRFRSYIGPEAYLLARDLSAEVRTVYEEVLDHAGVYGVCARGLRRGADRTRWAKFWLNLLSFARASAAACAAVDAAAERHLVRAVSSGARFVHAVIPGIDADSHREGPDAPPVRDAYRRLDRAVGAAVDALGRETSETLIFLVSDHGHSTTTRHFDIHDFVETRVGRTLSHPRVLRALFGARAATMVSGNAMAHVYLRGERGWRDERCVEGLARELSAEEAVDHVATREAGGVRVRSRRGEALLSWTGEGTVRCRTLDGDPFRYGAALGGDGEASHTHGEWLDLTADSDYPDAPVQILQLFASRRTGDLVVSSRLGWDLRARYERPPHRGSHGSLHARHMRVPLWCSEPLAPGPYRSADVFPTLLRAMGLDAAERIDGRPFAVGTHSATPARAAEG